MGIGRGILLHDSWTEKLVFRDCHKYDSQFLAVISLFQLSENYIISVLYNNTLNPMTISDGYPWEQEKTSDWKYLKGHLLQTPWFSQGSNLSVFRYHCAPTKAPGGTRSKPYLLSNWSKQNKHPLIRNNMRNKAFVIKTAVNHIFPYQIWSTGNSGHANC